MIAKIHNVKKRMPVILPFDKKQLWLSDALTIEDVNKLMKPYNEKEKEAYPVSPQINKKGVKKDIPEIVKPYNYDEQSLF